MHHYFKTVSTVVSYRECSAALLILITPVPSFCMARLSTKLKIDGKLKRPPCDVIIYPDTVNVEVPKYDTASRMPRHYQSDEIGHSYYDTKIDFDDVNIIELPFPPVYKRPAPSQFESNRVHEILKFSVCFYTSSCCHIPLKLEQRIYRMSIVQQTMSTISYCGFWIYGSVLSQWSCVQYHCFSKSIHFAQRLTPIYIYLKPKLK